MQTNSETVYITFSQKNKIPLHLALKIQEDYIKKIQHT